MFGVNESEIFLDFVIVLEYNISNNVRNGVGFLTTRFLDEGFQHIVDNFVRGLETIFNQEPVAARENSGGYAGGYQASIF